ncbi:MAG: hypothetical protein ABW224_17355 [Kibdelosporangium sp.]
MRRSRHRSLAAVTALLSIVFAGVVVGTASAERDQPAAHANSLWLARQLRPDGTLDNPLGAALPDHGLMIDVLMALHASGDGPLAAPIAKYLDDDGHATDYYTWDGLAPGMGYDAIIVGGAAAKTLVAAEVSGRDPRHFDGADLVAETKATVLRAGPDIGRISNYSKNPEFADYVSNDGNMFGQALGVVGLAGAGEIDQLMLDKMRTQQCSEGFFRIFFAYVPTTETGDHVNSAGYKVSTCDEGKAFGVSPPDGDTTGMALSAMLAARAVGAQGLDEPIGRTVAWLKANQKPDGGWGGGVGTETANTNSTGLIVQALAEAGGAGAEVAKGAAFIKASQVQPEDANSALSDDIGAIAYTPDAYAAAKTQGRGAVDTWIRAGAQASLGISEVGLHALTKGDIPTTPTTSTPTTSSSASSSTTSSPTSSSPTRQPDVRTTTARPPTPQQPGQRAANQNRTTTTLKPKPKRTNTTTSSPAPNTVVTPPTRPPQPGPALPPAGRLGEYLATRLVSGDHVEITQNGETFVDYEATADLVLALRVLGEQPETVERASRFLLRQDSVKAYAHGVPYEKESAAYAEPLAKLRIVAGFMRQDDDASRITAVDNNTVDIKAVIDQIRADLASLHTNEGEFVDRGDFADSDDSVRRHSWVLLASAADDQQVPEALAQLIKHQCADGTFPSTLKSDRCETGDPIATAAAVEALNGQGRTDTPSDGVPGDWPSDRRNALVRAVDALATRAADKGVVNDPAGLPDVAASSLVAGARNCVGLDVRDTTTALQALLLADGGLPKPGSDQSDLVLSVSAAQGVAGKSWMAAVDSPVSPAVRLPDGVVTTAAVTTQGSPSGLPGWAVSGLVGLGVVLAALTGLGTRRYLNRKATTEGNR